MIWMFALKFADRTFIIIRTIVIARLLVPRDFGIFGIALLLMSFLEVFTYTGFYQALVQKKDEIRPYLDTAWTVQVIRGVCLLLFMFIASPIIARFFKEPASVWPLRITGFSLCLLGLANPAIVYFQKELEFHKQFIYQLSGIIVGICVTILTSILLRNVWALVLGNLARNITHLVISYLLHRYRPRFSLERKRIRSLFSFGFWVWLTYIVIFLTYSGDSIVVGRVLGAASLGLYQMAYLVANTPFSDFSTILVTIFLPVYSKLQDERKALRSSYFKVLRLTAFLSLPIASLVFILAKDIVMVFLGEKWVTIIPTLQVLAVWSAVRSILTTIPPLYQAVGKPYYDFYLHLIRLAVLAVIIYPFTIWWGIRGTALSLLIPSAVADPFGYFWLLRITGSRIKEILAAVSPSLISSCSMIAVLTLLKIYINLTSIQSLIFYIPIAAGIFFTILFFIDRILGTGIRNDIRFVLSRIRLQCA